VTDAHKPVRQDVQQEAANELVGVQSHRAQLIGIAVVPPTEGDFVVVDVQQPMVRDRHSMSVAAEVVEHLCGAAERSLGIDDPIDRANGVQKAIKRTAIRQVLESSVKL